MDENETVINFVPETKLQSIEKDSTVFVKPSQVKKPKVIKKPVKPIPFPKPKPKPVQEQPTPQPTQQPLPQPKVIKPKKGFFVNPNEPKETMGYDTINPFLYKFANYLMLPSLVIFIVLLILTIINYFFFPTLILNLYGGIICTVAALITFILIFLITGSSLKKNDLIIFRKFRAGAGTISRVNLRGKSELLFDKKDPASKVLISWAGAITDVVSGCRMIQISEGHPTNDNLNSQVTESEWDKDVSRLTKAKSIADLAEAELFNQGLFGLKWQDIVLIVIAIMCLGTIGYLIMGAPDAIAKKTMEHIMDGSIQNAMQTAVQQGLINAGILTPVAPVPLK